jgi:hypothetical protein
VRFAQDNYMVGALASDGSDQSFGEAVLPRREEQAIAVREVDATAHRPLQHNQLMSECRVLCLKSAL